jgi:hypothetical protein
MITDSGQAHLFGDNAKMPKFGKKLSEAQIDDLVELIWSQQPYAPKTVVGAAAEH